MFYSFLAFISSLFLFQFLHFPATVDAGISPQDKIKNFTRKYVSNFLTDDQYYSIAKDAANGYSIQLSQTDIYNLLQNSMMNSLTNAQLSQAFQWAFCLLMKGLGSQDQIMVPLGQAASAMGIRLKPFFNQTMTKVLSMKAAGSGPNAILQQIYYMIAQFETQTNICKLMAAAKNAMSAYNWNAFRICLGPALQYANCGY